MLVFKCKIKILTIIQLTYILYYFKANSVYLKYSWMIKSNKHSTFERNMSLAFLAQANISFKGLV